MMKPIKPYTEEKVHQKTALVPFNQPAFVGPELSAIHEAITNSKMIAGMGPYTAYCESLLEGFYGTPVLLTTSCTHALQLMAELADLKPGDEVIVPSFTFVSTASIFVAKGCTIKFADCDAAGQLCLESVQRLITPKTKVISVVHYASHSADMPALSALCQAHDILLFEDAAQAIGAYYHDKLLGTWGDMAALSFHETKNITSGEGGALIVNQHHYLDRARILREKGTNRAQFLQGLVDKYTWVDVGSNYTMSDMNAAYLSVQLDNMHTIFKRRQQLWRTYQVSLGPVLEALGARMVEVPGHNTSNHHIFGLLFQTPAKRNEFIAYMKSKDIVTPFHYVALHLSPVGCDYLSDTCMLNTQMYAECLVRLPLFYNLSEWQQSYVIQAMIDYAAQTA